MKYRSLGKSGLRVSEIGFGCWGIGGTHGESVAYGETNDSESLRALRKAYDLGVNFFDTAELYAVPMKPETRGKTSQCIGEWFLKNKKRDKIILADKVVGASSMDWLRPNGEKTSLNKKQIEFACNRSLKDLKTDYIDLYQVHWTDRPSGAFSGKLEYEHKDTNDFISIEETLDALNNLVKVGKVRHIGISNETAWGASQYIKLAEQKKNSRIVSIQNAYNFLNRSFEVGLSEIAIREKVGAMSGQEKPETLGRDEMVAILLQKKASEELISEINEILETADAHEFAGDASSNLPLQDWQVRIKRLLKNIRSLA